MDEARLFSVLRTDRKRSSGLNFEHKNFNTSMEKSIFMVTVMERWHRLPRGL